MRTAYPVAAVREAEAALMAELPAGALMQRAASALARRTAQVLGRVYGARVVLLVGSGDNGGDALYAGALLAARGARVDAVPTGDKTHQGGLAALRRADGHVAGLADSPRLLPAARVVVDGLVGLGAKGALREPAASLADQLQACAASVVAVDLPSGVDADTGAVHGSAVRADVTVTFGAIKPGLLVTPGKEYAGIVDLVDIGLRGLPPALLEVLDADDVARLLPQATYDSSKYGRGVVGVLAGSDTYTGAAVLAAGGAVRAGAGMVRFVSTRRPSELVRARWPEVVVTEIAPGDGDAALGTGRVQAWVIGPGLGTDDAAGRLVRAVLDTDLPVLVDADGLSVVSEHPEWLSARQAPTLVTPHTGEFERLTGIDTEEVEQDRIGFARRAADHFGVTVLLKGSTTVVAEPGGRARVNPTGTSRLATAGSGDVLSGGCGALLAQGLGPLDAGSAGAFLHGLAGSLAARGAPIVADDIVAAWPKAVRRLRAAD